MEQMHADKVLLKSKQTVEEKLKAKVQEKTKVSPINLRYKELLIDLIEAHGSKPNKELKILLENEINSIGSPKNPYKRIENFIK